MISNCRIQTYGRKSDGFDEIVKALHDEVVSLKQTQMICRSECLDSMISYETRLLDEKNEFNRQLKAFQDYDKEHRCVVHCVRNYVHVL